MSGEKPRLTEAQKKQNHIESEKKRREAIRHGFDRICEVVPNLEGLGRSESIVLQTTVAYAEEQLKHKEKLRALAMKEGFSSEEFERAYQRGSRNIAGTDLHNAGTPGSSQGSPQVSATTKLPKKG